MPWHAHYEWQQNIYAFAEGDSCQKMGAADCRALYFLDLLAGVWYCSQCHQHAFFGPDAFGDFKFLQTIWALGALFVTFGLFTTGGNLLAVFYTEKFIEIVPLVYICAVAAVLRGMGDVYNRYLLAHGKVKILRSNAIHLGFVSALGCIFLVAWGGVSGAAATKLIVDTAYLFSMIIYYKFVSQKNQRLLTQ